MTKAETSSRRAERAAMQRGFGLIEVMVALIVLSVAVIGLAGLQTVTLRNINNALLESQAATLAQDLIERVRANPQGTYAATFDTAIAIGTTACEGVAANCDPDALALYDLMRWKCSLGASVMASECAARNIAPQLPSGDGEMTVVGDAVTIRIRWFDASANANRTLVIESVT